MQLSARRASSHMKSPHYYWSGNTEWIDEGLSELLAAKSEQTRTGARLEPDNLPCAHARTIAELENLGNARGSQYHGCNYSVGERLFLDLHRSTGSQQFRASLQDLYEASLVDRPEDRRRGTEVGINHLRAAFDSRPARETIKLWYEGPRPPPTLPVAKPVDPNLRSINGRVAQAYITIGEHGPAIKSFTSRSVKDWMYLRLEIKYSASHCPCRVNLDVALHYEDGFPATHRTVPLDVESQYIGITQWVSLGPPPDEPWAPGQYWVHVYHEGRIVANEAFVVKA